MKKALVFMVVIALLVSAFPPVTVFVFSADGELFIDKEYVNMDFEEATATPASNVAYSINAPNLALNKPTGELWDSLNWTVSSHSNSSYYKIYGGSSTSSDHPWDISTSSAIFNGNTSYYLGAGNKPARQVTLNLPNAIGASEILCLDMRVSMPGASSSNRDSTNLVFENEANDIIFFLEAPNNNIFTTVKVKNGSSDIPYSNLTYPKTSNWKCMRIIFNFKENELSLYLGDDLNNLTPLITDNPTVPIYNTVSGLKKIRTSNNGGMCFDNVRMYSLTDDVKPSVSNLSITGKGVVGTELTASYAFKSGEFNEVGSTSVWESANNIEFTDDVKIIQGPESVTALTGSTYILKSADIDKYIRFTITPCSDNPNTDLQAGAEAAVIYSEKIREPKLVPIVSLTAPTDGLEVYEGKKIVVSANASSDLHNITKVEFYAKNTDGDSPNVEIPIGADTNEPYSVDWIAASAGKYDLFARATDDNAGSTVSAPISITVLEPVAIQASNYYKVNATDPDIPSWQKAGLEETATPGTYRLINKDNDDTPNLTDESKWYEFNLVSIANGTEWSLRPSVKSTYKASMVVPGSVDGKPVTEIAGEAFRDTHGGSARYVVVSENIRTIAGGSFRKTAIVGIKLPRSLTTVGDMSFFESGALTSINLEETSLISTGCGAFRSCGFSEITLPATLKTLGTAAFSGCTKLKTVTFLGALENSNSPTGTGDNGVPAFNGTSALERIIFNSYIAPCYNTTTSAINISALKGFTTAGIDYQVTVHYPKGGLAYDSDEFMSGFREGTTFVEMPKVTTLLEGKPNLGAELEGSFSYIDAVDSEENSIGYWESCNAPYFGEADNIEKISDDILLTSGQTAAYMIKPADSGKYIRFCVKIPSLDPSMPEISRLYTSAPTQRINYFEVTLEANGNVAGSEFYVDDGIGSYGAAAKVFNSTDSAQEFCLISSWYSNSQNIMVDCYVDNIIVPAGSASESGIDDRIWTGRTKAPNSSEELEDLVLKVFAIKKLENVTPLAPAREYSGIYDRMAAVEMSNPGGLYTKEQFDFVRAKIAAEEEPWKSAFEKVVGDADAWIAEEPSPVAHWYVPGFYTNAAGHQANRTTMMNDLKSAYACGLAYQLTGKPKYADQTIRILNAWARTTRTIGSEDSELVGAYVGNGFPMAAELVKDYTGWSPADKGYFDSWLRNVYRGFLKKNSGSNAADWSIFARLAIDSYLGNTGTMANDIALLKGRIETHIAATGELPEENVRGHAGIWYTYFALAPMTASAQIIYNTTGENLFNYVSPSGRTLKLALDKHLNYCDSTEFWPYDGDRGGYIGGDKSTSWNFFLYEAMADIYKDQRYLNYVESKRPVNGPLVDNNDYHHMAWFYPTLMSGSLQLAP